MKLIKFIICKIFIVSFFISPLIASNNFKIITKVGNEIITSYELENKIKITLFLAGEELNQSNISKIKNLSLRALINNRLKKEEIKKYKFNKNNERRISNYLENLAKKFNLPVKDLNNFFINNGLEFNLFLEEIKTEFQWQSLIYQIYGKKINIEDKEITNELNKVILDQKLIIEYNLSEIETKVLKENELKEIINHINNFNFEKAAQKYSVSTSSINGGSIGWVNSESLSKNILELLKDLKVGEFTKPLKRDNSYFIFYLNDKRKISNFDEDNLERLKKSIVDKKTNDLLTIYSNNHLSIKRNKTLIDYQ